MPASSVVVTSRNWSVCGGGHPCLSKVGIEFEVLGQRELVSTGACFDACWDCLFVAEQGEQVQGFIGRGTE